ncbi:MAG: glycosyltransferase family 2 protein [Deltaproteobacteria bacterium]|jgi:glycosyltransferase involved in cell wall biosynthesis|nr:glycosyltransferase family 2 protein [Deltaproteobacteria bacterium]
MSQLTLDVLILAKNEAAEIVDCLNSAKALGPYLKELIVVDDFSQDQTASLAKQAGARVVQRRLSNFADQRNFALSLSSADWVFFLDCDERLSPALIEAIQKSLSAGQLIAGEVKRRVFAFGRRQRFGPLAGDKVVRLFPRTLVQWTGLVHERPLYELPKRPLAGYLEHHTYATWAEYLAKWSLYASLGAQESRRKGRKASAFKAATRALGAFGKMFFGKLGFLGGPSAWALCWFYSGYTLAKYLLLTDESVADPANQALTDQSGDDSPAAPSQDP